MRTYYSSCAIAGSVRTYFTFSGRTRPLGRTTPPAARLLLRLGNGVVGTQEDVDRQGVVCVVCPAEADRIFLSQSALTNHIRKGDHGNNVGALAEALAAGAMASYVSTVRTLLFISRYSHYMFERQFWLCDSSTLSCCNLVIAVLLNDIILNFALKWCFVVLQLQKYAIT